MRMRVRAMCPVAPALLIDPAQAKAKGAQLVQEVAAVQTDRDELQKKYEAKSRCVRAWWGHAHEKSALARKCASTSAAVQEGL
jgi:hypothetical protein